VTDTQITLLVEDFQSLVSATGQALRLPSLEQVFSRGRTCRIDSPTANHLRFALFGIDSVGELPVAALTHVSDRKKAQRGNYYWLRTDPVTMWADMAQVFMTSYGFADLDPYERNEIENCIRNVLLEEGIDLHSDNPERWCIALSEPLEFDFTPLNEALGMDVADALPSHPEARYWRRILNEVQVALHNCPVNMQRRQSGKHEVNSVWFWGGGFIPEATPHYLIDTVYSNHPVTRGLAIINDCRLKNLDQAGLGEFSRDGRSVLIDWMPVTRFAQEELEQLDVLVRQLLQSLEEDTTGVTLLDGSGRGRFFDRKARRRFWRRRASLTTMLSLPANK
jgi:hypothetical protein